jgi:hypothetical protein
MFTEFNYINLCVWYFVVFEHVPLFTLFHVWLYCYYNVYVNKILLLLLLTSTDKFDLYIRFNKEFITGRSRLHFCTSMASIRFSEKMYINNETISCFLHEVMIFCYRIKFNIKVSSFYYCEYYAF